MEKYVMEGFIKLQKYDYNDLKVIAKVTSQMPHKKEKAWNGMGIGNRCLFNLLGVFKKGGVYQMFYETPGYDSGGLYNCLSDRNGKIMFESTLEWASNFSL